MMYQIGRTLRATRAVLGITQLEMAKRLGISEDTYRGMERNLYSPSALVMRKLSEASGMSKEAMLLINMSIPKELDPEHKMMFNKVQGELVSRFVSGQVTGGWIDD